MQKRCQVIPTPSLPDNAKKDTQGSLFFSDIKHSLFISLTNQSDKYQLHG